LGLGKIIGLQIPDERGEKLPKKFGEVEEVRKPAE
jgi:hypothetical protein